MSDSFRRPVPLLVLLLAVVAFVLPGGPALAATGKYYVVAEPVGGQREFLYQIAVNTLGDGNRYPEIFELNKARVQPDGGRLTDPLVLEPGWFLELPQDAEGRGVRTGAIPSYQAVPPVPSQPPAAATQPEPGTDPLIILGGVTVAFVLLLAAVMILQGGRGKRHGSARAVAPAPPAWDGPPAGPPPVPPHGAAVREPEAPTAPLLTALGNRPGGSAEPTTAILGVPGAAGENPGRMIPGRVPPPPGLVPAAPPPPGLVPASSVARPPTRIPVVPADPSPGPARPVPAGPGPVGSAAAGSAAGRETASRPGPPTRLAATDWPATPKSPPPPETAAAPSTVQVPVQRPVPPVPATPVLPATPAPAAPKPDLAPSAAAPSTAASSPGLPASSVPVAATTTETPPTPTAPDNLSGVAQSSEPAAPPRTPAEPAAVRPGVQPPPRTPVKPVAPPPPRPLPPAPASVPPASASASVPPASGPASVPPASGPASAPPGPASVPSAAEMTETESDQVPPTDFSADLVVDGNRITVSLVGVTGDGPGIPYGWRSVGQAPLMATLPVALGDRDDQRLHLDLGRCPDVLTVTGAVAGCEQYTLRLIRQVLAGGHAVAVLGDTLFADALPDGCRRVAAMTDVSDTDWPGIVVAGRLSGKDLAAARMSRSSGGPVPVLVGEMPRARWSVLVNPA
ncbi:MAG TPA: hypothetical protein VN408_24965 [Actinoplanes sp.]|nr:hypothetical protein [Actinoplanes sp.]